jgi:hypothetical protein
MVSNFSSAVVPGTRPVVAMAPALTRGFIVRSALSSIAITELKGRPGAIDAKFVTRLLVTKGTADQGEDEQFGDALDRELHFGVSD